MLRGADTIGEDWAKSRAIAFTAFAADRVKFLNAAGPQRNAQMLREEKPDHVFALLGGKGTVNMVDQAKEAGVPVTSNAP